MDKKVSIFVYYLFLLEEFFSYMFRTIYIVIKIISQKIGQQKIGKNHKEYYLKNDNFPQTSSEDRHISESIVIEKENRAEKMHIAIFYILLSV